MTFTCIVYCKGLVGWRRNVALRVIEPLTQLTVGSISYFWPSVEDSVRQRSSTSSENHRTFRTKWPLPFEAWLLEIIKNSLFSVAYNFQHEGSHNPKIVGSSPTPRYQKRGQTFSLTPHDYLVAKWPFVGFTLRSSSSLAPLASSLFWSRLSASL